MAVVGAMVAQREAAAAVPAACLDHGQAQVEGRQRQLRCRVLGHAAPAETPKKRTAQAVVAETGVAWWGQGRRGLTAIIGVGMAA